MEISIHSWTRTPDNELGRIFGLDRRKIKKLKRKGYYIDIISDMKLFSHYCGRGQMPFIAQEFAICPKYKIHYANFITMVSSTVNTDKIYFNKSFRCQSSYAKRKTLRNFIEIDPDMFLISEVKNPYYVPVDMLRIFKDEKEYLRWKLTR